MFDYTLSLEQRDSHNGVEYYPNVSINDGQDKLKVEYVRNFTSNPDNTTYQEQREALRAFLVGGVLNDSGVVTNLTAIANDPSVTDLDTFTAAVAAKLA